MLVMCSALWKGSSVRKGAPEGCLFKYVLVLLVFLLHS